MKRPAGTRAGQAPSGVAGTLPVPETTAVVSGAPTNPRNVDDATHSYRGYRRQAVYTLWRILCGDTGEEYQPEGLEDLAIYGTDGRLLEVCQIKAYSAPLTLSDFKPDKKDSFIHRIASLLVREPHVIITLATFGALGSELDRALHGNADTLVQVANKVASYGIINANEAQVALRAIQPATISEAEISGDLATKARDTLLGVDPEAAIDLLTYWLYLSAEEKKRIRRQDIIQKLTDVGKFLSGRAAHHKEWFTVIRPIEDRVIDSEERQRLAEEYYQGVQARYDHILADLDVQRPLHLERLARALTEHRVVVLHAASGQGKTTLAYRYLHDYLPDGWRFQVAVVESREHALSIERALTGFANAVGLPILVYLDVSARDLDWPVLAGQLATHRQIRTLVTVREEDWQRTTSDLEAFNPFPVDLALTEPEARDIYEALVHKRQSSSLLNFEDAWSRFGGDGPLLEFAHLVTQDASLRSRLLAQVTRLQNEVRTGVRPANELLLLRLVSVASAYEARLDARAVAKHVELVEPAATLRQFEREYLLRLSPEGTLVGGLHPIRSTILADLLTDSTFEPWVNSASGCLQLLHEPDMEVFLLHSFLLHRDDAERLLEEVTQHRPRTWAGILGVIRSLVWLGVADYVDANADLIRDTVEDSVSGWYVVLDFDIADVNPGLASSLWDDLNFVPVERLQRINAFRARQTPKALVYVRLAAWLSAQSAAPEPPKTDADWAAASEAIFWSGRTGADFPVRQWIGDLRLDEAARSLPIERLADLSLALDMGFEGAAGWRKRNDGVLLGRLRQAAQVVNFRVDETNSKVSVDFFFPLLEPDEAQEPLGVSSRDGEDRFHAQALRCLRLLRGLFPEHQLYACQGYGHRLFPTLFSHDNTTKTGVDRRYLPPSWLTSVNTVFSGYAMYQYRPKTWSDFANIVLKQRLSFLELSRRLENSLQEYFRRNVYAPIIGTQLMAKELADCRRTLNGLNLLPACVVDAWGFATEQAGDDQRKRAPATQRPPIAVRQSPMLRRCAPFLKSYRDFVQPGVNFVSQAPQVLLFQPMIGRQARNANSRAAMRQRADEQRLDQAIRLATQNLSDVIAKLPAFQNECRELLAGFGDQVDWDQLERDEGEALRRLWSLWYRFTVQPEKRMIDAVRECKAYEERTLRLLRSRLEHSLSRLPVPEVSARILSDTVLWEGRPGLWIAVDGANGVVTQAAIEPLAHALRDALSFGDPTLRDRLLESHWPTLLVVPLVRGQLLSRQVWSFWSLGLTSEAIGLQPWHFIPKDLPPESVASLGLAVWNLPNLEIGDALLAATATLSAIAAHLRDFASISDIDPEGYEIVQGYFTRVSERLSSALQETFDARARLAKALSVVPDEEIEASDHLRLVSDALHQISLQVPPMAGFNQQSAITLDQIAEWATRLEEVVQAATIARLAWASEWAAEASRGENSAASCQDGFCS